MSKGKARVKRAAETVPVPCNEEEAAGFLSRIGAIQRDQAVHQAAFDEAVAALKDKAQAEAAPLKTELDRLMRGLQLWAEANRDALTHGGRTKTVKLATGEISWRYRPPSVRIVSVEVVLAKLRELQLGKFIREKIEVDKEAMLREPAEAMVVPGVTIASAGEEFVATPATVPLDERSAA